MYFSINAAEIRNLLERLFSGLSVREAEIFLYQTSVSVVTLFFLLAAYSTAYSVLHYVATWRLFKKAGEQGWKSLIPFYNQYTLFKLTWKKSIFWIYLILSVSGTLLLSIGTTVVVIAIGAASGNMIPNMSDLNWLATANIGSLLAGLIIILTGECILFALAVIEIISYYHLAKAYNRSVGFFFGLLFLTDVFYLILGFDSGLTYLGNAEMRRNGGRKEEKDSKPDETEFKEVPVFHNYTEPTAETTPKDEA